MKRILIAGNWKMNTNAVESEKLAEIIKSNYTEHKENVDVLVCPPFTSIASVASIVKNSKIFLGAQNCEYRASGAYTGEVSISMLKYLGVQYVITGHSERRAYYHESNDIVNKKAIAIMENCLIPIVCIGETLEQRQMKQTFSVLTEQIEESLNFPDLSTDDKFVVAYEPVWAIGTGISATVTQIAEAHSFIREKLCDIFDKVGNDVLIQYGGSVTAENAKSILEIDNVNGALIGGASLKGEAFISIINTAKNI